jgi:hypothetical protein
MTRGAGRRLGPFRQVLARLTDFWNQEHALSVFCVFLVLVIFVVNPLVAAGFLGKYLLHGFGSLVLVSGVMAIAHKQRLAFVAAAVVCISIVSRWLTDAFPSPGMSIWSETWSLATILLLTGVVLAHTFKSGAINFHRIQGSVAVYLLLGIAWSHAYFLVSQAHPGAFNMPAVSTDVDEMPQFVYYSFVTLTTVGYGDITPVHPFARSLATLEALVGQLYPAILIARLVSMEIQGRMERQSPKAP